MDRIQQRKITRNRELRACTECRKRKLKCNRQLPCSACIRRHEVTTCSYEKKFEGALSEHGRGLKAEARLEHLEQLVQQLSQSQTLGTLERTTPNVVPHGTDQMLNGSLYNGATHWSAMLEDIEELRTAIKDPDGVDGGDTDEGTDEDDGSSLLFRTTKPLAFDQILSNFLPPRHETDCLVAAYFRAKAVAAPFIHAANFARLYRLFWDNLSAASPLWTSILFSILEIATRTLSTNTRLSSRDNSKDNRFATAAAHCLAVGEYYRPQRFAVESLLLYLQSKCLTGLDISPDVAILFSTSVRLATVMGYHRDADGYREQISAFEGEMRRRTWSLCMQLDILVSFQLGLPSNVQFPTWDTRPPTNLLDADFDEDTVNLPPQRPDSEPTELLFYIAKHRLITVFEKILRHTLSETCYYSASDLVKRFLDVYKEFEPGGQLETERWFKGSITWYDFLLGCIALCFTVCATRHSTAGLASTAIVDVAGSLELLRAAKAVCEKRSVSSKDTRKVRRLVEATILKFSNQQNSGVSAMESLSHSARDVSSNTDWQVMSPQRGKDGQWDDSAIMQMEDPAWAYMEQFLDLPSEYFMTDT